MESDVDSSAYRTESRLRDPLTKRWVQWALTLCPISEGIFWLVLNESRSSLTEPRLIRVTDEQNHILVFLQEINTNII
ncbi:hypothetical protein CgunFtcFv8_001427 [Champsocephalus gunnari]|uniref:Uncharacterized protein n=1 Tax=Champsocephalus gunnari TaxID=52237 RepID=A0AAN8CKW9_CHAGU|nr:hypothetical protein CgunFtcFv8_001427 [Champsocephalus gunnari]